MQPYFFPYIGYFQLIKAVDKFIIYENVSFRKRTWITRNRLLKKGSGEPYFINVPVKGASSNRLISQIKVCDDQPWREQLCASIYHDYKQAAFFDTIYPKIQQWVNNKQESLHEFNAYIIQQICTLLSIDTAIQSNGHKYLALEASLEKFEDTTGLSIKSRRVLDICHQENASDYINPMGGTTLYVKEAFNRHGVDLSFIKPTPPEPYRQFDHDFVPNLSIIDELMHKGPEKVYQSLTEFNLT